MSIVVRDERKLSVSNQASRYNGINLCCILSGTGYLWPMQAKTLNDRGKFTSARGKQTIPAVVKIVHMES